MNRFEDFEWVIIDTETTGLTAPVFTVEIGAQRMRGWEAVGEPFCQLLNHNVDMPEDAFNIHGYTREFLAARGGNPSAVHEAFAEYAGVRPVCAYNLKFDWDKVLVPEWKRLGLKHLKLNRGICFLRLTRGLIRLSPTGNFRLQSLRKCYGLPDRGAHSALGDVQTVIDLSRQVLKPLYEERGISTWEELKKISVKPTPTYKEGSLQTALANALQSAKNK
ncbi:MAG TPA: 3'-5' exonuclease [Alcanivoracaceae bacterium]|nr:3'-5' exonuclease [Alcanivoracaceae bacterium]